MSHIKTPDGINWYYQQSGSGPDVVLIPSGEGDCTAFDATIKKLSQSFTVTTFDMPGLSRSIPVPPEAMEGVTGETLARQIIGLMDTLHIPLATFYGCSSGAATALALQAVYPARVRNVLVHEMPTPKTHPYLPNLHDPSETIDPTDYSEGFVRHLVGDRAAWLRQPADYRARINQNLPVWEKVYIPLLSTAAGELVKDPANLKRKPVDWTIGAATPTGMFFHNAEIALTNNLPLTLLPGRHFPQVTHPEELAEYIEKTTKKYL